MVSGVIDQHPTKYKSNKKSAGGGFFSTSSPSQAPPPPPISAVTAHHNNKRFSESDLRPWPPMYAGRSARYPAPDEQQQHHHGKNTNGGYGSNGVGGKHTNSANNTRSMSSQKMHSNNGPSSASASAQAAAAAHHHYKNNTHKPSASGQQAAAMNNNYTSSSSSRSIYDRNKYNFNGGAKSSVSSMASLGSSASVHSNGDRHAQDYYMLSQPYATNSLAPSEGSVYASRDSNLLMKERDKSRFRKLRNPTTSNAGTPANGMGSSSGGGSNARSSSSSGVSVGAGGPGCPCAVRSKSMEDVRSDVVVADWPTYIKENFKNLNNGREVVASSAAATMHNHHNHHHSSSQHHHQQQQQQHPHHGHARGSSSSALTAVPKTSNMRRSMDNLLKVDMNGSTTAATTTTAAFLNTPFGGRAFQVNAQNDPNRPRFVPVTALEDVQAVRCAEFHPNGKVYAVGSNSKTFRICEYPSLADIREDHTTYQPTVLFKRTKHHKGSIYCMAWSPQGDLVATGSNDKTVKLMRYNELQQQLEGKETELTMHDGTVRDLCFLEDSTNKASLLISGGAGDCKVYVTDCATATPFQALSGHGGHILSLYNWGGAMFVSGSQDKTVRFWDLRTRGCVNTVTPATVPGSRQGSPVAAVCVDPSGRLLVSGHEDSSCVLYDIRGNRPTQCFKPHATDVRSIRFSPSAYYLLTAGYDNKLVLTDLQGDLTMPLPSVVVAQHSDKVISGRWHPTDFSFLSTSADKTATLWALPPI